MLIERNSQLDYLAGSLQVHIVDSGYACLDKKWQGQGICSPFSRIYYVISGEGRLRTDDDGKTIPLLPGQLYFIPIGLTHSYSCPDRLEKLFFHITVPLPNGLDLFRSRSQIDALPCEEERILKMEGLYRSDRIADAFRLQSELMADIGALIDALLPKGLSTRSYSQLLQRLFALTCSPITARNNVRNLAKRLNVSESTLSHAFREQTGETLGSYLDELLMNQCCRQLITTRLSIAQLAEELGFSDQFYFSRYFKRHMGEPPSVYRRRLWESMGQSTPEL